MEVDTQSSQGGMDLESPRASPTREVVSDDESSGSESPESSQLELILAELELMRANGTLPEHLIDLPEPPHPPLVSSFDAAGVAAFVLRQKEELVDPLSRRALSRGTTEESGASTPTPLANKRTHRESLGDSDEATFEDDERDIVVLGGAGMSTSAGIPDFRSPGTGLYDNLQKYDLPRPQAIFELEYFKRRPAAFYELARELWPGAYPPTPTHLFIRLLHEKGRLLRCFTQNIDSLETAAGLPSDRVVAAHGNFDSARCVDTRREVPIDELKHAILGSDDARTQNRQESSTAPNDHPEGEEEAAAEEDNNDDDRPGWMRLRDKYGGLVKPEIVFFGEPLPQRFFDRANADLPRAKILLVVGTSLSVQPFASLINYVDDQCQRVLINRDPVGLRDKRVPSVLANELRLGGFDFDDPHRNYRDVALLGDCDAQIIALAEALGWKNDLERLVDDTRKRWRARHHHQQSDDDIERLALSSVVLPTPSRITTMGASQSTSQLLVAGGGGPDDDDDDGRGDAAGELRPQACALRSAQSQPNLNRNLYRMPAKVHGQGVLNDNSDDDLDDLDVDSLSVDMQSSPKLQPLPPPPNPSLPSLI